uniref:Mannan endo-1,4-beta-mannosidase n=1 Tax=Arundo donax TaxID=35708 RepID=A0A0A9D5V2_ARUDO
MATFEMTIVANNLHGDYQLANGYGPEQAKVVLTEHLSQNGINAVRIPVGWWIACDPDPPAPFVGGSLNALDRAFYWAQ